MILDCQCAAFLMLRSRRDAQLVANSYPMEGTWAAHHAPHVLRISWVVLDGFITFHHLLDIKLQAGVQNIN
jgi:hypothetical protein